MKLTFLGTRGYIKAATPAHSRHSALLVNHGNGSVMVDCGADWKGELGDIGPDAVILTHAHPDHAWGLADGAPCPVYATEQTWSAIADYPIADRRDVVPRAPVEPLPGLTFEAFPVMHSLRAPAVGYRISASGKAVFYVPDVVDIEARAEALKNAELYVGDGSTLTRSMVRRGNGTLFGHTTVRAQLGWCEAAGVPRALFTHCGSEIVAGDEQELDTRLEEMGRAREVKAAFAHDGLTITLG